MKMKMKIVVDTLYLVEKHF